MTIEIKAPTFPESVQEGTIATWHKKVGDAVTRDELVVDIETDKVVLEVAAPGDGVLKEILREEGQEVQSNELLARIEAGAKSDSGKGEKQAVASDKKSEAGDTEKAEADADKESKGEPIASPAARKLAAEKGVELNRIEGTGRDGRITKEDVVNYEAPPAFPARKVGDEGRAGSPQG